MDLMNISLIGILTSLAMGGTLPDDSKTQQQVAQVSTHILPNIAGQWHLYADTGDGLPALAIQTQYDNNATDCSGNRVDQTGDILVAYVKQQGEQMQWCKDSKGTQCAMTLYRVLP